MNDTDRINAILLAKRNMIGLVPSNSELSNIYLGSMLKGLESVGYTLSPSVIDVLKTYSVKSATLFYESLMKNLKGMTGADKKWEPMYPNFPEQVMEADEAELYVNAMCHYLGDIFGVRIMPKYEKNERLPLIDISKLKVIELAEIEDFKGIFTNLMSTKTSISSKDAEDLKWVLKNFDDIEIPSIGHKEVLALVYGTLLEANKADAGVAAKSMKTATDELRLAVALSDGDVSLAAPTRFRNFKRKERRFLLNVLENIANNGSDIIEDMKRHKNMWIRLGERLHPSEYKSLKNVVSAFDEIRNGGSHRTFNSEVEKAFESKSEDIIELLSTRPSDFARRLDHVLRESVAKDSVLSAFEAIVHKVSTNVLLQVMTHFDFRNDPSKDLRIFMPKGSAAKIHAIKNELPTLHNKWCGEVVGICKRALVKSYSKREKLGKVYVDPKLSDYIVPFSQRSSNESLRTVPRGSRLDISAKKDTLRFFVWWKDINGERVDLDLSALMFDDNWESIGYVSYTRLKNHAYNACHSGDITSAPEGASEFIDIDMPSALNNGGRYIVMSVLSYTNHTFSSIPECFCGWMNRECPQSGEIFEEKTVEDRLDLNNDSVIALPLIFDLKERKAIFCDIGLKRDLSHANNVEGNLSSLGLMGKAMEKMRKTDLYTLFVLNADARGEMVDSPEEADVVYSVKDGDVTPFDIDVIASEFV